MATSVLGSIISHRNYFTLFVLFLFFSSFTSSAVGLVNQSSSAPFNRSSFPPGFLFGAASSAYQKNVAEKIADRSNGDVANNFYNLYKEFGDRVKYWITFNEPFTFTSGGYDGEFLGSLAPGRCSSCPQGNSATEPYVVAHHILLAHAASVKLYREKYQATQKGEIGITLVTHWFVPYSSSRLDIKAAQRALDFVYGWFVEPVVYGNYPRSMQSLVGSRLPKFTEEESAMLKGSFDFLGLNYYTGNYAAHVLSRNGNVSSTSDSMTRLTRLHDLLVYTKNRYNDPTIYITESGMGDQNNETLQNSINDPQRVDFYSGHLNAVRRAIGQGVNVKGFIAWSFLDNFEWGSGYTQRFGLCYVDYKNGLKRIPKQSALWFRNGLIKK
ncbi:hypothetical protein DH2020_023476 [Rehmannia glutinosa]|uniref:Beta-glucosidase n=1 Tax=Rehmannia glutinosa TaxID=99300 RepID=A0ABR0W654_REHGL